MMWGLRGYEASFSLSLLATTSSNANEAKAGMKNVWGCQMAIKCKDVHTISHIVTISLIRVEMSRLKTQTYGIEAIQTTIANTFAASKIPYISRITAKAYKAMSDTR